MSIYGLSVNGYSSSYNVRSAGRPMISSVEFRQFMKKDMIFDEIKQIYPMTRETYRSLLKRFGFGTDKTRIHRRNEQLMIDMYNSGHSMEEIAKARNISLATCKKLLAELKELKRII